MINDNDGEMPAITRVYWCTFNCGWFREYNTDPAHAYKIISHPYYGTHTEAQIARFDIAMHDCNEYWRAKGRLINAGM